MNQSITTLILVSLVVLFACESDSHFLDINELKGSWEFVEFVDKNTHKKESLPEGYLASISIHADNCIQVSAPCNSGSGRISIKGNKLEIVNLALTEMACPVLSREDLFVSNLEGNYIIDSGKLTIVSKNDRDLVFQRMDSTLSFDCF